jgi:hypothetical protein
MTPTISPLARGWVATIAGQPCRVLGLASRERWRLRRPNGEHFTVAVGAVEMAAIEASLRRAGKLGVADV